MSKIVKCIWTCDVCGAEVETGSSENIPVYWRWVVMGFRKDKKENLHMTLDFLVCNKCCFEDGRTDEREKQVFKNFFKYWRGRIFG